MSAFPAFLVEPRTFALKVKIQTTVSPDSQNAGYIQAGTTDQLNQQPPIGAGICLLKTLEPARGIEPPTYALRMRRSTVELRRLAKTPL